MNRSLAISLGLAALLLLCGCPSAPTPTHTSRPLPEPFVDASLKAEIEDRGGEFADSSAAATSESLANQLDRTSCTLAIPSRPKTSFDLPGLYRASLPGTLVISKLQYCQKCERWHAAVSATAFALTADGACVTNYHVFSKLLEGSYVVVADAWGRTYPVQEVLAASRKDDAAIFRVDVGNDQLTPLPLRAGAEPGEVIAVLSHPEGHFYSFSPGHVSRRVWRYRGLVGDVPALSPTDAHVRFSPRQDSSKLAQTLEITADYGVGASGGPVLDLGGNVVGMVSNTIPVFADPKERRTLQMNFHLCVPAESILKLIRAPGARAEDDASADDAASTDATLAPTRQPAPADQPAPNAPDEHP